jgi:outer membrane protein TolC
MPAPEAAAPATPSVPGQPSAPPATTPSAAPPAGLPAAPYRELTLDEALATLDRQNLTLAQVRSRADQARAVVRETASALLPTLTASGSYVRNSDSAAVNTPPIPGLPPMHVIIQPLQSFSGTGTARLPIIVPQAWYDLTASRQGARAAGETEVASRRQVRAGFIQSANNALAVEEAVVASENAIANAAELVRSAERRIAAGTAAPLDALKARTELVRRESDLTETRSRLDRARLGLGVLLGRAEGIRVTVPPPPSVEQPVPPEEERAAEALANRPEVRAQAAQVGAAEASVKSAWARLAPTLSASASAFAADVPYPTGQKEGWRVSVDLTWSLYDGGFRYGKRREAEAALAGAHAADEAQRLSVTQEAVDAGRDLEVARERFRLAESERGLASDTAASAKRSFDAGIASSLDVIDANDRLFQADIGLATARANLASSRVALTFALGRGP